MFHKGAFTPHVRDARWGDKMRQTRSIGLKGNQQVLLHHRAKSPHVNGFQSHLATQARAIANYSTRGSNSPAGVLVVLGFATKVINVFRMLNASVSTQDWLWCKNQHDQGTLTQTNISSPGLAHGLKEPFRLKPYFRSLWSTTILNCN